jgi:hypothetical protein
MWNRAQGAMIGLVTMTIFFHIQPFFRQDLLPGLWSQLELTIKDKMNQERLKLFDMQQQAMEMGQL